MKKSKLVGLAALLLSLGVVGCGEQPAEDNPSGEKEQGGDSKQDATHEHTFASEWSSNDSKHWHAATCEHTTQKKDEANHTLVDYAGDADHVPAAAACGVNSKSFKKCSVCGYIKTINGTDALQHELVDDAKSTDKAPTCEEEGQKHQKCSRTGCTYEVDTKIDALGHDPESTDTTVEGIKKVTCKRNGCDYVAYELDIAKATGWKKADTKWNAKSGTDAKASWNVEGIVENGKYAIELEALLSYESHQNRYFYNQWETDSGQNPDTQDQSPFRYYFSVNDKEATAPINPDTTKNWGELGYQGQDKQGVAKFARIVSEVEILNASTFAALHGNIGYSMIVSKVRLVKLADHAHNLVAKDVAADADSIGYRLEECACDQAKISIAAKDGTFKTDTANKSGTPDNYIKLSANNDYITYTFKTEKAYKGKLYMVGRQDSYPGNKSQNPFNCDWYLNDSKITFTDATKNCEALFGAVADTAEGWTSYSPEGKVEIGTVELTAGTNVIKYVRKGSYNIAVSGIVFEGQVNRHSHNFVRDNSKDVPATCTTKAKEYSACECGEEKVVEVGDVLGHDFTVDFSDATHVPVAATIAKCGKEFKKCSREGCTEIKEFELAQLGYNTTGGTAVPQTEGKVAYELGEHFLKFAALDTNATITAKKSAPDRILKLDGNGSSATYVLSVDKAINGKLYFVGMMDAWNNSFGGNQSKKMTDGLPNGSTETTNFTVTVKNGADGEATAVDVDAVKGYTAQEVLGSETVVIGNANYSKTGLIEVGKVSLTAGVNTIVFKRNGSYNYMVSDFVIIF